MIYFRRFVEWLVKKLFPRAVSRIAETKAKEVVHEKILTWQTKMGGPGKRCVNPLTGQEYYEYGLNSHEASQQRTLN